MDDRWLVQCPVCGHRYVLTTTDPSIQAPEVASWPDRSEQRAGPVVSWRVPAAVTVIAICAAGGALLWHRDAGAVLAAVLCALLVFMTWQWWWRA